jgi:Zn-dependent protease
MKNPFAVTPETPIKTVGHVFGTPVIVIGHTWLPIIEILAWLGLTWFIGKQHPTRSLRRRAVNAALAMPVLLGSEWLHNLAHVAAARLVDRPMDALRVAWGMPLCVYYDINDRQVKPRQHIFRALGGPILNSCLALAAIVLRRRTRPGSTGREVADLAVSTNLFLGTVSLLPIAGIDGGPILKWSLVSRGQSIEQADQMVRKVNGPLAAGLGAASLLAARKRHFVFSALLGVLAQAALAIATGLLKE